MEIPQMLSLVSALNSETRLKLVSILLGNELSTKEVTEIYNERFDEDMRRESVYRALEQLRDVDVLYREYDEEGKSFKYSVGLEEIVLDFSSLAD